MTAPKTERAPRRWRVTLAVALGLIAMRVLTLTWRYREHNAAPWRARRADGKSFVFVLWHGTLGALVRYHRALDIVVLISEHRDGEIIARMVHAWGFRTIRGSTSRGAGRALLGMIRELEAGSIVAVTPDGPRGPARRFQPGALVAAQRAGVPIVPITMHVDRAWRLRSWDGFMIPKPFARITINYGDPERVQAGDARGAAEEGPRFEAFVNAAERRAAELA